ncbi:hypothetical protein CEXT_202511 [Caerostris extrusa]|uniref:Uncharacterized protein n=1 Tax=Caerostris extrusa TaxID=172846 RepID=A0AAV4W9G9_CAEEX|nr:hypothetical protein CEXT_202511 [Caerostris extrusa]
MRHIMLVDYISTGKPLRIFLPSAQLCAARTLITAKRHIRNTWKDKEDSHGKGISLTVVGLDGISGKFVDLRVVFCGFADSNVG